MPESDDVEAYRLLIAEVYELAGVSRRVSEREATGEGATVARWHVLSVVSAEPIAVPGIARRLGQVRQGVQRVVDELVEDGHLVRRPNTENARSPLVEITATGHALLDRLWTVSEVSRRAVVATAELDAGALHEATDTLRRLTRALSDREHRPGPG